jgi:hypothetical protein
MDALASERVPRLYTVSGVSRFDRRGAGADRRWPARYGGPGYPVIRRISAYSGQSRRYIGR